MVDSVDGSVPLDGEDAVEPVKAISPYAGGGGGSTFAHYVALTYVARMLLGEGRVETDELPVTQVHFQVPNRDVDDLLIVGGTDEDEVRILVAVRRSPNFVRSHVKTRALVASLVREIQRAGDENQMRIAVAVADWTNAYKEVQELSVLARSNIEDEESFYKQVHTPERRSQPLRSRYRQLSNLIKDSRPAPLPEHDLRILTWRVLGRLWLLQFRVEVANEADWSDTANALNRIARPPYSGVQVRDRLFALCVKWDLLGAEVNERVVRRHLHAVLGDHARSSNRLQAALDDAERFAFRSVRSTIGVATGNVPAVRLERPVLSTSLRDVILDAGKNSSALIVVGESGTGKSALVLTTVQQLTSCDPDKFDAVVVNLRYLPDSISAMRSLLANAIVDALKNSPVEARIVVVDAADAVLESGSSVFGELTRDAHAAGAGLVAISADTAVSQVQDQISTLFTAVRTFEVPLLSDEEITQIASKSTSLAGLLRNLPQRSLLRRLVVLDLLVRTTLTLGSSLTGWGCLEIVWRGLVRRNENSGFGSPEGREHTLLTLAERELGLHLNTTADPTAVDALRRDHLVAPYNINDPRPRFAHDELRRYAVALLLFRSGAITGVLEAAEVPRWAMSAAQLACQGLLLHADVAPEVAFERMASGFVGIGARYGARWADVPIEAALESAHAYEHLRGLPLTESADSPQRLDDVIRVVEQRHTFNGLIDVDRGEPVVRVLLEHDRSWLRSEPIFMFVAAWLQGLVATETPAGNLARRDLRGQLIEYWQEHYEAPSDVSASENPDRVIRWLDRAGCRHRARRGRGYLDYKLTDAKLVELFALLGADIDGSVEQILAEISECAPAYLAPAADSPLSARAVAQRSTDLTLLLMERYYIDVEPDSGGLREDGIREHSGRWRPVWPPFAAYWLGGFWQLFNRVPLNRSASLLNKMLNHAARYRVEDRYRFTSDTTSERSTPQESRYSMSLSGRERLYVGDGGMWNWYRGSAGGPYPCMSALQAMERLLDQYLEVGIQTQAIIDILLAECENLAVPALLLGVMIRHIEVSQQPIEPFLTEPIIWALDSSRVTHEHFGVHAPESDQLAHSERRTIALREVCMRMVLSSDHDGRERLKAIGERLADKGSTVGMGTEAAGWAAFLDIDRFRGYQSDDQLWFEVEPPEHVLQWQARWEPGLERANTLMRIQNRYTVLYRRSEEEYVSPTVEEISADLAVAEGLLEAPAQMTGSDPLDAVSHLAFTAIRYATDPADRPHGPGLTFALKLVMSIVSAFEDGTDRSDEFQYYPMGSDRAAAAALPLLLLPCLSDDLATAGFTATDVDRAATALTSKSSPETRLYLARGCDHLWSRPCGGSPCFHHTALHWLTDTARDAEIGPWDSEGQTRANVRITADLANRLVQLDDDSIHSDALDAAIRGFGAAAASSSCVSAQALTQLNTLLHTHRRAMVAHDRDGGAADHNQTQSLVAARALVHAATTTGIESLTVHLSALRGNAHLLANFLHMLAAVGAETPDLGTSVRTAWPGLVEHALTLATGAPNPYTDRTWGDWALAALIPRPAAWTDGPYIEIERKPFDWVVVDDLIDIIPRWVALARGRRKCVDDLIGLLHRLSPSRQVTLGLKWVQDVCVQDGRVEVHSSPVLNEWLIGICRVAEDHGQRSCWQSLVDRLVAAGNRPLAPYSV
ncbi:hypothetical protein [Nocardia nova]|uniref:hypothetical protein n=1 Tax=Nocardia nova TaxID=37330 RepID=UPI0034070A05